MGLERCESMAKSVSRLYTDRHALLMYGLVRWLQPRTIVEVGSFHGFTTMHLAQACEDNGFGEVVVIDDFSLGNSASVIHNNLYHAGLAQRVRIISGDSQKIDFPRCDFAFIDGDHSFDGCRNDCDKAISMGATCLCVHDSQGWWGPREYVALMREQGQGVWDVMECGFDSGLAVIMKRPELPPPFYTEEQYPTGKV